MAASSAALTSASESAASRGGSSSARGVLARQRPQSPPPATAPAFSAAPSPSAALPPQWAQPTQRPQSAAPLPEYGGGALGSIGGSTWRGRPLSEPAGGLAGASRPGGAAADAPAAAGATWTSRRAQRASERVRADAACHGRERGGSERRHRGGSAESGGAEAAGEGFATSENIGRSVFIRKTVWSVACETGTSARTPPRAHRRIPPL